MPRGRPTKYTPEERKEKNRIKSINYYTQNRERLNEERRNKYKENMEIVKKFKEAQKILSS